MSAPRVATPISKSQARAHGRVVGVRVLGIVLPPVVASWMLATVLIARRRRRATRRLNNPEPRRADGPLVRALGEADCVPAIDAITPYTLAVLAAFEAAERKLPQVLGAWETEDTIRFLLEADPDLLPEGGVDKESGIKVEFTRDGGAVADATGQRRENLRRGIVPFVDQLLVPVGGSDRLGWLHLPLLGEPIAVTGEGAERAVEALLKAAAMRAGADLTITITGELLAGARAPEGVAVPPFQRISPAGLATTLTREAEKRAHQVEREHCDTFAELAAAWPASLSGWLFVLDPATASACAAELAQLAPLGVGALVLGETPEAPRRVDLQAGKACVTAPGLGTIRGLLAWELPESLVEEIEAQSKPIEDAGDQDDEVDELNEEDIDEEVAVADRPEPAVRIQVLGGYRVERRGAEVAMTDTSSARARELVAYLAVKGGWVSAKELRKVLWPDELDPEETKVKLLHQVVSRARQWTSSDERATPIIEHRPSRSASEKGGQYRLAEAWVDVAEFRSAAERGTRDALEAAMRLYDGDLLAGQETATHYRWVGADGFREQERWRHYRVAGHLAEALLEEGDPGQALAVLEPVLATPDAAAVEDLACIAMRCEAARSSSDGIRRRYSRLCVALEQEEASAETAALCMSLLSSLERPARHRVGPKPPDLHVFAAGGELSSAGGS